MRRGYACFVTLALLVGCSSGSGSGGSAPNPVDVLRKIPQCVLPAGASVGDRDFNGNRTATCGIDDQGTNDQLTVYTYKSNKDRDDDVSQFGGSTDSNKVIVGDRFTLEVTGVFDPNTGGVVFEIDPQTLAQDVGGELR